MGQGQQPELHLKVVTELRLKFGRYLLEVSPLAPNKMLLDVGVAQGCISMLRRCMVWSL